MLFIHFGRATKVVKTCDLNAYGNAMGDFVKGVGESIDVIDGCGLHRLVDLF